MKSFIALITLGLTVGTVSAAVDHTVLKKEMDVMVSVFKTSLQQADRKTPVRIRQIDSTYLANQGAVFTVSTTGHRHGLVIDLDGLGTVVPEAPLPPITMVSSEGELAFGFQNDWEEYAETTAEQVRESLRMSSEQIRELKQEEREVVWGQRELQRELNELQFQLRNGRKEDSKELQQELERVEKEVEALNKKKTEVRKYVETLEQEKKQKQEERKQAKEKMYRQFLADFEANLSDTLCRFGAGLRGLPEGENVTFVLNNIAGNKQDRIYVFDQKNIIRCVQTSIDAEELISKANIYEF